MSSDAAAVWTRPEVIAHTALLLDSFQRLLGRPLHPCAGGPAERAACLYHAPLVVVSHTPVADPILHYGNAAALALWEMDWDAFTRTPSRLTAEPDRREDRARALAAVAAHGFLEGYSGVRISSRGRRFHIEDGLIWNLTDAAGVFQGQAATFTRWTALA
ncbi:MAG: MEKHLA domain-containing protein [Betaproteobacteria bacterium]|nr:MEKHLA domain-containing protein [Betaproteobacteria bacterium]